MAYKVPRGSMDQEPLEVIENQDDPKFSPWVKVIIWLNIIFGIRFVISCITQMIFEPTIGIIELIIQIIGIISLAFILDAKKWAFFTWAVYIFTVGIFNCVISGSVLWIIFPLFSFGLMCLMLQIKRDGISAWDVIFNKKSVEEGREKQGNKTEELVNNSNNDNIS